MLSERAKGKQRAIDPPLEVPTDLESQSTSQQPQEETARDLVVRFTEGVPDLTISVDKLDYVRDVKKRIREMWPELQKRRLRLIHSGRLLPNGTLLFSWLVSLEERQKRATTEDSKEVPSANSKGAGGAGKGKEPTTWIHCSVGPVVGLDEVEDDNKLQTAQLMPARGFDRLASVGFSPEDIENFRRQFHSQSSSNYLDVEFATEEEYDEHARALEEQWIDSMDTAGTAALSQTGSSNSSVLPGVLIGFFFPFLPFFFMRARKPPVFWDDGSEQEPTSNVIFSRRTSMGLVVGFLVNILFGLWRYVLDSS